MRGADGGAAGGVRVRNVVFIGPPGAGKGTQARVLAERLRVPHIASGDLLREAVQRGTPLGRQAQAFMQAGGLVPDDVVVAVIQERLEATDAQGGFILDGFPRTHAQAAALDRALSRRRRAIDLVVYFDTSEAVIRRRLAGRRVCRGCGRVYHVETMRPAREGVCDVCGGALIQREDDQPDTIARRLEVYHEQTRGVLEVYAQTQRLARVPGDWEFPALQERLVELCGGQAPEP